jgi:glycogen debranching enzyme
MLKEQVSEVLVSASLKVGSSRIFRQSDSSESGEQNSPVSPSSYYHPTSPTRQRLIGVISGLPCSLGFSTSTSNLCKVINMSDGAGVTISINEDNFIAGSFVIYKTALIGTPKENLSPKPGISLPPIQVLWQLLGFNDLNLAISVWNKIGHDFGLDIWFSDYDDVSWPSELKESVKNLEMEDINIAVFRSSAEEHNLIGTFSIFYNQGTSTYIVPNYGELVYAGLQGMITPLLKAAQENDLGHPMCSNLREGPWMIGFIIQRLEKYIIFFLS